MAPRPVILVVTSTYPRWENDTLPRFVHDLCRRLVEEFEIHVLAPSTPGAAPYEQMDCVHVHRFRYFFRPFETLANVEGFLPALKTRPWRILLLPFFFLAEVWSIGRLARRYNVSLIQAHWIVPQGFAVWLARRLWRLNQPVAITCHGADLFALNDSIVRFLKRKTLADAAAVTTVSEAGRKQALELGARANALFVYPMGVDLTQLFTPAEDVEREPYTVLFVGRLNEKKGAGVLIEAMPLVSKIIPNIQVEIVGYGPYQRALQERVAELRLTDMITFRGAVGQKELPNFYNRASCLAFPSVVARSGDQEGLGLVLVEALGCGCPVVASRLDAVQDIVQDGHSGLLFTPGDSNNLAKKIIRLLANPAEAFTMATNGRSAVRERYDWPRAAGNYRDLFYIFLNPRQRQAHEQPLEGER